MVGEAATDRVLLKLPRNPFPRTSVEAVLI